MLQAKRVSQITLLQSPALHAIAGVAHAFSTRRADHTQLTLGPTSSDNPLIPINRFSLSGGGGHSRLADFKAQADSLEHRSGYGRHLVVQ
jgi:hypothetical protein